jgi:hypothetical protein
VREEHLVGGVAIDRHASDYGQRHAGDSPFPDMSQAVRLQCPGVAYTTFTFLLYNALWRPISSSSPSPRRRRMPNCSQRALAVELARGRRPPPGQFLDQAGQGNRAMVLFLS